jgi:hypothetical protein
MPTTYSVDVSVHVHVHVLWHEAFIIF